MPDNTPPGKIFPRNLTAKADHVVRGNPPGTRPESGVDNCYPGLEFDQRNLDRAFFPGLRVDFQRLDGSRVLSVAGGVAAQQGLTDADLTDDDTPVHLWAVCGRTTVDQTEDRAPVIGFQGMDGLDVWRRVRDLLPGRIAVVLGPQPGRFSPGSTAVGNLNRLRRDNRSGVLRGQDGRFGLAVLVADRARYLDPDGVIDPEVYEPGDLTRTLCAPWQYDFRDCGCYYWAASKPDVTSSADGAVPQLNYLRRDRSLTPDLDTNRPPAAGLPGVRRALEFSWPGLIRDWGVLPPVLNDREADALGVPAPPAVPPMTRSQVVAELKRLATVEHALCVEYLFAHYSLNAPRQLPDGTGLRTLTARIHTAASEVFAVAVDEMRHLRWVNEALGTLNEPVVLGRAASIDRDGPHAFELRRLDPEVLQWFIDVEAPSQAAGTGIDGMYVRLHETLVRRPELFPEDPDGRLAHLVKLIIDEGGDHFHRFTTVQRHLSTIDPQQYLRTLGPGDGSALQTRLLDLSDQYYALLLGALHTTLGLGDRAGGVLIEQSRRTMTNLHETNHALATRGVAPRFTLPAWLTAPDAGPSDARPAESGAPGGGAPDAGPLAGPLADGQATRAAALAAIDAQQALRRLGDRATRSMAIRQQRDVRALLAVLDLHTGNPAGGPGNVA
ncbi:ferritin-like domain-containing protein [Kitasatospora sp. NPDC093806]|uniref:ferritin-like domain-containing protein n=1 Tax=Kitasatospora sp. NPDC093806 TaxID=3155075 RepID=UPI003433A386